MTWFTERQARAWPEAVEEAQRHIGSDISTDLYRWIVEWGTETRPGEGHFFYGVWIDGDSVVEITMDAHGYSTITVGEVQWLYNSLVTGVRGRE